MNLFKPLSCLLVASVITLTACQKEPKPRPVTGTPDPTIGFINLITGTWNATFSAIDTNRNGKLDDEEKMKEEDGLITNFNADGTFTTNSSDGQVSFWRFVNQATQLEIVDTFTAFPQNELRFDTSLYNVVTLNTTDLVLQYDDTLVFNDVERNWLFFEKKK